MTLYAVKKLIFPLFLTYKHRRIVWFIALGI